jgi:CTP:molybdopterin cytidylyltransferase MocA
MRTGCEVSRLHSSPSTSFVFVAHLRRLHQVFGVRAIHVVRPCVRHPRGPPVRVSSMARAEPGQRREDARGHEHREVGRVLAHGCHD